MTSAQATTLSELLLQERTAAARYPLSRWYLRPLAGRFAARLAASRVRPIHLTLAGLGAAAVAGALLALAPAFHAVAGMFVLLAWFFDRADGLLARRQGAASRLGAWLDANIDELTDIGLHLATALAAAQLTASRAPYVCLIAFIAGKYLFMHGLASEPAPSSGDSRLAPATHDWPRTLYHFPANADVRLHLLFAALVTGWLTAELALVAAYYNFRWLARYALVVRRLRSDA